MVVSRCLLAAAVSLLPLSAALAAPSACAPSEVTKVQGLARMVGEIAGSGDASALNDAFDWKGICEKATEGFESTTAIEEGRRGFISGVMKSVSSEGFGVQIANAVAAGGSYTLLRVKRSEQGCVALFRLLLPEGSVNYHELQLAERPNGRPKILDVYVYLTGEHLSSTLRRGYLPVVKEVSKGLLEKLVGKEQEFFKHLETVTAFGKAAREKKGQEALALYAKLPPSLQSDKNMLILRFLAAQSATEADYLAAMEALQKTFPNDPGIELATVDAHFLKGEFTKAADALARMDLELEDPYLQVLRASALSQGGDDAAAKKALLSAIDREPTLANAYVVMLSLQVDAEQFAAAVETLELWESRANVSLDEAVLRESFPTLGESAEFAKWVAGR